jgi:hypothetical protein
LAAENREKEEKPRTLITIDPKELVASACVVKTSSSGERWAVCVDEDEKIKIYPIVQEKKHHRGK